MIIKVCDICKKESTNLYKLSYSDKEVCSNCDTTLTKLEIACFKRLDNVNRKINANYTIRTQFSLMLSSVDIESVKKCFGTNGVKFINRLKNIKDGE